MARESRCATPHQHPPELRHLTMGELGQWEGRDRFPSLPPPPSRVVLTDRIPATDLEYQAAGELFNDLFAVRPT
jgi:hypothetical protein